jgi:hypothetical protein
MGQQSFKQLRQLLIAGFPVQQPVKFEIHWFRPG